MDNSPLKLPHPPLHLLLSKLTYYLAFLKPNDSRYHDHEDLLGPGWECIHNFKML